MQPEPRHADPPSRSVWRFGTCEFDDRRRELRVGGTVVDVETKPLDVLRELLLHAGEVVTKDELLESVWPGTTVVDGSLATAVSKLRKALGSEEGAVVTVPRIGYRLGVPVQSDAHGAPPRGSLVFRVGDSIPGRDQWRLIERLDASPSHDVWVAEHPKTRERRVFKFAPDETALRGLKREVTLARLLHDALGERPDFVRLLEWNFTSPPYCIESEYAGPNLAQWAEAHGGLSAVPLERRLALFVAIADAVAAAHSIDVLHKDLKPANVLVSDGPNGEPRIKVADFGSASLLAPARLGALGITNLGFTRTVEPASDPIVGSLLYAAPEILAGQSPSPAADVYALGVLLYQLTIGVFGKPLAPGWEADVADPALRDDIAAAACGDPSRRLASAAALADRVRRLDQRRGELTRSVSRRRVWSAVAVAALVVVAVAAVFTIVSRREAAPMPTAAAASNAITSLAVLPLANLSGDPAQDYLADGLTEALITELSKIHALRVISRTSAMQFKGAKKPLPEIARDLNVNGILEGSVLREGDRVRVTAQLIRADTDTHVWADSFDRDLRDILNLQRELARQVSQEIRITVQPSERQQLAAAAVVDPKAYDLYLRGRFFWNRRTRDDLLKAVDLFTQATAIDAGYPLAYAGLADAYVELVGFGNIPPVDGIAKAKAAATKSIALNDALAEPHAALAYARAAEWDWAGAEVEFKRALELNAGYSVALYQYGFILSMLGRQEEAIALMQQALATDPLSSIVRYRTGRVYYQARQFDRAVEQFDRILEMNPNDQLGLYGLGLVHAARHEYDEAIAFLDREGLQRGLDAAAAYAAAGRKAEARRRLAVELERDKAQRAYTRPGWIAEVYVALGDHDEAIRWLERGYAERDAWLALLNVWPPFDPLRSDPRFQDLLRRLNFPHGGGQ